jgi:CO dehydrogenase/acetyl-CoA synthase delta subunit
MSAANDKEAGMSGDADGGPGALSTDAYEAEDVFEGAEPWAPIETKLVLWSFIVAAIALAVFGTLVNIYLL